jgi:8-oxo-dGTP pyrophosphatase MutT (NUDIX family)
MASAAWEMLEERQVATSPRADVLVRTYRLPEGLIRDDYVVVDERSGVLVVAVNEAGEVLLVQQYRAPIGRQLWELPAGALEPEDEHPEARARKELEEETGHTADVWHSLGAFNAAPHRSTELDHGFLALGARRVGQQDLDEGESVRWKLVSLARVEQMIDEGQICSAPTLVVLLKALRLLPQLRGPASSPATTA